MPSPEPSFALLLGAAAGAALVVGFLKTSIGGGIGLALTPTLSLVLPPATVLALVAPLLALSDPIALRYYWRQWDGRQLRLLLPTAVTGVVLGAWALSLLSEFWLRTAIGVMALGFGLLQLVLLGGGWRLLTPRPHWSTGGVVGLLTGLASSIAHSGGIILGLYLVNLNLSNAAFVGTSNALVAVTNVVKLTGYWQIGFLTGRILLVAGLVVPALAAGGWLGYRVNRWLPRRWLEVAVVTIAIAGSVRLLLGA